MRMVDLIEKKRDGQALTDEEINFIIQGYTKDEIPDYQISALAMAIYFQDMNAKERARLTMAMVESGDQLDLSSIEGIKVDKHSTGGVGDKTTIALAPLVAALGVPVAKMSGRGLGHTGGTIDKLESVPGFSVELTTNDFIQQVNQHKLAVVGQTANLTPADKKLYGLRDVTGTVNSIPLIASSVMSKKIASGADAIVLDVKVGSGAFMKEVDQANELATAMVEIGKKLGRQTVAIISDMNQPLGRTVGNALEIREAIELLKGEGPKDLHELCLELGSQMVYLAGKAKDLADAKKQIQSVIENGKAIESLKNFLEAQGGDPSVVDDTNKLPQAKHLVEVLAEKSGYVEKITADKIGTAAMKLGAGRATKDSSIDLAVGIELHKKIGDYVEAGQALATLHSNNEQVEEVKSIVKEAYTMINDKVEQNPLIYDTIH
ncbi:pyrimidine-nucleoside phosphorylase [Alkalihalobacillus trypoxylicola]|uniref:Pyrimidine-nucleoside phosphorylase n=1 Tax=Alkalihalobacillus trypoxylicola TaxID=519424 RepID=A0A162DSC7_9BACI|nr:pyrimidine-nucleoside phosphorylase [Alkalihalobacillus trypoxylicola]KYG30703.1 thymidine phosphorylase [Alkalihalobacillus trypoxylicola]